MAQSPILRTVTDAYAKRIGIDLAPDYEVDNLSMAMAMAMSLVASTGGIALMPLYARNLLPSTVISRPLDGAPPTIDLSLSYNEANTSPLLKILVSKISEMKFSWIVGRCRHCFTWSATLTATPARPISVGTVRGSICGGHGRHSGTLPVGGR